MKKRMLLLVAGMLCLGIAAYARPSSGIAHQFSADAVGPPLQIEASFNKQQKWWDKVWPRPIGQ
jgi:hypothetical protein